MHHHIEPGESRAGSELREGICSWVELSKPWVITVQADPNSENSHPYHHGLPTYPPPHLLHERAHLPEHPGAQDRLGYVSPIPSLWTKAALEEA